MDVKPQKALARVRQGLIMNQRCMGNLIVILPVLCYYLAMNATMRKK